MRDGNGSFRSVVCGATVWCCVSEYRRVSAGTNCHSVACVESIMCANRLLGKSVTTKLRTSKGEVYEEFVCAHTVTASAGSGRHRTTVI